MELGQQPIAEPVGDPDIAMAVDVKSAGTRTNIEILGVARIGGWKSCHVLGKGVAHPDSVLLVDPEMERTQERLAGFLSRALANDPALGQIALREVDKLALRGPEGPDIAAGRDDDALHQPEPAVESDAVRRRQRLA